MTRRRDPSRVRRFAAAITALLINLALRVTTRRAGLVLVYHTIGDREGNPQRELVPPLERSLFRRRLQHLLRNYDVVPLDRFLSAVASRRWGKRFPVCVTFDDDSPEHVRHAIPELRELGVPATFFLCGRGLIDGPAQSFWWQRLQRAADRGVALERIAALLAPDAGVALEGTPRDIHRLGKAIERLTAARRDEVSEHLLRLAGPDPLGEVMSADDIAAVRRAGFAIGFHTYRHDPLTGLDEAELERALHERREALARVVGRPLEAIAYPNGAVDTRVADAVRRAGFRLGLTCWRLPTTPKSDPCLVGRFSDTTSSLAEFSLGVVLTLARPGDAARTWRVLGTLRSWRAWLSLPGGSLRRWRACARSAARVRAATRELAPRVASSDGDLGD